MHELRYMPIGPAGSGLLSWTFGTYQIAGIKIDNPSGSWILLPDGTFVPPYTLGFGHSFQPRIALIDVLWANGPAGQVSTQQGDQAIVTIYSNPVGESPGIPSGQGTGFIEQFTPVITASALIYAKVSGSGFTTLFASVVGKRYRILTTSICYSVVNGLTIGSIYTDSPVTYRIEGSSGITTVPVALGMISPAHPVDPRVFPNGVDCPTGAPIRVRINDSTTLVSWADAAVQVDVTAMLI